MNYLPEMETDQVWQGTTAFEIIELFGDNAYKAMIFLYMRNHPNVFTDLKDKEIARKLSNRWGQPLGKQTI